MQGCKNKWPLWMPALCSHTVKGGDASPRAQIASVTRPSRGELLLRRVGVGCLLGGCVSSSSCPASCCHSPHSSSVKQESRQSLSSPGTCRNRGPGCRASGLMVGAKGAGAIEPVGSPRSTLALTLTAVTRGASAPPPKPSLFQTTWEKGTSLASMTQN